MKPLYTNKNHLSYKGGLEDTKTVQEFVSFCDNSSFFNKKLRATRHIFLLPRSALPLFYYFRQSILKSDN